MTRSFYCNFFDENVAPEPNTYTTREQAMEGADGDENIIAVAIPVTVTFEPNID